MTKGPEVFHISDVQKAYHFQTPKEAWGSAVSAGQTISGESATSMLVFQRRAGLGMRKGLFGGRQEIEHPKTIKRQQSLGEETSLMSSASLAQQYTDIFTVVASTEKQMIKGRAQMMGMLKNNGYKCRVITGRSRQLDAFITGTLGIQRL